jgi:hypothetical protein
VSVDNVHADEIDNAKGKIMNNEPNPADPAQILAFYLILGSLIGIVAAPVAIVSSWLF